MIIDLKSIDLNSFNLKEGEINGNKVFLVTPNDFSCEWTKDNLNLRSILVDENGNILSKLFDKFFNLGEKPDLYPDPNNFNDWVLEDKVDGSLVGCSWIFNQFHARTRGTVSYKTLETSADFDFVFNKYPNIESICRANPDDTFLFEIYQPNHKIILDYGKEPELFFLGFIHKLTNLYYPPYSKEG